ncbi:substrate-binding domain-containing protein [Streptomyces sp. NPDC046716]|uniref:substrate-binding domain-containing protein n=1 Tax=Streptomyces sp. NPDC046716 TaxID=3157093 RepID=UPI0033CAFFA3
MRHEPRDPARRGVQLQHHQGVLVGYDDSPVLDFIGPPLTTVRQPIERIAENVGRIITSLIGHHTVALDEILVEPELRLRRSTAPAPDRA